MSKQSTTREIQSGGAVPWALTMFTFPEFEEFWPGIETMLDTVPHTWKNWSKEYILTAVAESRLQVWGIGPPPKAVFVFFTQVSIYPVTKILTVPWGAGSFEQAMLPTLEAALVHYARMNDCSSIEVRGRPGWDPHFKTIGMKREYVTWSLPVSNVRMN